MTSSLPKEIFRAYDIRGIYPDEINETGAELVGKALGTHLRSKKLSTVVIGRDGRESSGSLVNSMSAGLISTGINVIDTGVTVEPAVHYFTFLPHIDASVNITASHNPGQFNGIKIDLKNGMPCFGDELLKLYEMAKKGKFKTGEGTYTQEDLNPKYIEFVSSKFNLKKKIKVVVYCGNGATSEIYPKILQNIGAEVAPLRCYLDSDFPAGVPDPESGNFFPELITQVDESKAQIGVGYDGDGDRLGVVDEKGGRYNSDQLLMLYAKDVLHKHPRATIIFDVKTSQTVPNYIETYGGKPKIMRTGRSYFLQEMYAGKAMLGGELSGHVYFKDDYLGFDDGIYATCRILRIMDESGKKLSELLSEFPKMVSTPEIKIPCPDDKKFAVVAAITKEVKADKTYSGVIDVDGVRAMVSDTGWFLIRASNTSAHLSVRVEGRDADEVGQIIERTAKLLAKHDAILNL